MKCYLSLGSNMGKREVHLKKALDLLKKDFHITKISSLYETSPIGIVPQDNFLNFVLELETDLSIEELFEKTELIEKKVGDGSWAQIASEGKNSITWNDTKPTGGQLHEYRIYAYAGNNSSNQITTQITPLFTATISTTTASNITSSSEIGRAHV